VPALEAKERAPAAVSVQELNGVLARHGIAYTRRRDFQQHFELGRQLRQIYPDLFVVRYEDFVDDHLDALREHLGIDVKNKASLGAHVTYNERSKSYGGWRDWFTPSDVDHYRPTFRRELKRFRYDTDWLLAADPASTRRRRCSAAARTPPQQRSAGRCAGSTTSSTSGGVASPRRRCSPTSAFRTAACPSAPAHSSMPGGFPRHRNDFAPAQPTTSCRPAGATSWTSVPGSRTTSGQGGPASHGRASRRRRILGVVRYGLLATNRATSQVVRYALP